MQINKLLPRDIEKLSYVQKELYVGFPDESKEILLAIKDIRSSNLEEDEIDLLLEGIEENLKTNPILIEEINKILGFKDKVGEVKDKIQGSDDTPNRVIVANEPYAVSEKEIQELNKSISEEAKEETLPEVKEEIQQEPQQETQQEPQQEIKEEIQEPVQSVQEALQQDSLQSEVKEEVKQELPQDVNMKIEDLDDSHQQEVKEEPQQEVKEEPQQEVKEEPQQEVKEESQSDSPKQEVQPNVKEEFHEDIQKEVEFKNVNKLLKAMIDFIVKDLTVETYRSFNVNSDEEVVKALLKEEGYNV